MMVNYEETLLGMRFLCHAATAVVVASYFAEGLPKRYFVSVFAWMLAASSAALAVQVLTQWATLARFPVQPWLVIFAAAVLGLVIVSRGNCGKFIPRRLPFV